MQNEHRGQERKAAEGTSPSRLDELKRLIREGQYETDEKLDAALRRMLPDLRGVAATRVDDSAGEST
ncbi:MAG: hypothetical protein ACYTGV_19840 [Planctomycetota bacterium]